MDTRDFRQQVDPGRTPMATINNAWNIAVGALQADQAALNVVANNISNANSTTYSRQVSDWQENTPLNINGIAYGTGASVTGVTSIRDSVLEKRIDQQTTDASGSSARLSALDSVQQIFTVPTSTSTTSSGTSTQSDLSSVMTDFFNTYSTLESAPTNTTYRTNVMSAASTLTQTFNNIAKDLTNERNTLDNQVSSYVTQINSLTKAIATLNNEIQQAGTANTGTLEDQRQADIKSLSNLIGVSQISTENNGLTITTSSGAVLVAGGSASTLTTGKGTSGATNSMTTITLGTTDLTSDLTNGGGTLGGILTVRDQDIPSVQNTIDTLAKGIISAVNTVNAAGYDQTGTGTSHGIAMLTGTGAGDIAIASGFTSTNIAASGVSGSTGDGSNASTMASLLDVSKAATYFSSLGTQTPVNYYSAFITNLGSTVSQVNTTYNAQSASLSQLQSQRNSLSAVSLDDEAASLQVYQRSYQAASKVFSILNTILAASINLGTETTV